MKVTKPIVAKRPYSHLQIDLADFSKLSRHNSGYKWGLTVIDIFTKKAWIVPLKDKTAANVWDVLKDVLEKLPQKPSIIQSDNGGEFKGEVSEGLKAREIKQCRESPASDGQTFVLRPNCTVAIFHCLFLFGRSLFSHCAFVSALRIL